MESELVSIMTYKHVLVIDDDIDDIEIFLTAINSMKGLVKCSTIDDSVKALQQLLSGEIIPDLIFLDLNMPVMTGLQCLVKMKQEKTLQNIPVIILSTSADPVTRAKLLSLGANHFITKPADFNELKTILKTILYSEPVAPFFPLTMGEVGLA